MYHGSIALLGSFTHWCRAFSHLTNGTAIANGTVDDSIRGGHGGPYGKQVVGDRYEIVPLSGGYAGRKVFDTPCRMWAQVTGSWSGVFRTGGSRRKRAIMK
jgi:hypothetical protein